MYFDLITLFDPKFIFHLKHLKPRAAVVHLNFQAGPNFPFPVCTVPSSMDRTIRSNKADAARLYASYRLNLLLLKGQICVNSHFQ